MKSTPLLRKLFAVALTTTFISLACRKNDWRLQAGNQNKQNEALFFNAYSPNSPAAQAVLNFTKNQNAQYHFAAHYLEQIGKPRWDKALVFESRNATGATTADSTIVYIPFVREAQHYVNASLIVNMKPGDTTFRMLCDWQYKSFGFAERRTPSSWNANSMMRMYMLMDKAVFGTENFKIKDVRLLPASLLQQLKAKQIPLDSISVKASFHKPLQEEMSAEASIYRDCKSIFLCINLVKAQTEQPDIGVVTQTFTSGCMMTYSDHECITYWDDDESDEGDLWSGTGGIYYGGGSSYSGTGSGWSGGSDGYWPDPTNPNPIDCMDYASYPVGQDYPCSRGWGPLVINEENIYENEIYPNYDDIKNPILSSDDAIISNGATIELLPDTIPPGRRIARTTPRNNTEDMSWGFDHDSTGIDVGRYIPPALNTTSYLFEQMEDLFYWCTFFDNDLEKVGEEMIRNFKDNQGKSFSHPVLNGKVFESAAFQNFAKKVLMQINDSLKIKNNDITKIELTDLIYRPVFNNLYNKFHGLQILVNDTEQTEIYIDNFQINSDGSKWSASVSFIIKDHFGLDKNDALVFQDKHTGFIAWWLLQHRRGYKPFETVIKLHTKVYYSR